MEQQKQQFLNEQLLQLFRHSGKVNMFLPKLQYLIDNGADVTVLNYSANVEQLKAAIPYIRYYIEHSDKNNVEKRRKQFDDLLVQMIDNGLNLNTCDVENDNVNGLLSTRLSELGLFNALSKIYPDINLSYAEYAKLLHSVFMGSDDIKLSDLSERFEKHNEYLTKYLENTTIHIGTHNEKIVKYLIDEGLITNNNVLKNIINNATEGVSFEMFTLLNDKLLLNGGFAAEHVEPSQGSYGGGVSMAAEKEKLKELVASKGSDWFPLNKTVCSNPKCSKCPKDNKEEKKVSENKTDKEIIEYVKEHGELPPGVKVMGAAKPPKEEKKYYARNYPIGNFFWDGRIPKKQEIPTIKADRDTVLRLMTCPIINS